MNDIMIYDPNEKIVRDRKEIRGYRERYDEILDKYWRVWAEKNKDRES